MQNKTYVLDTSVVLDDVYSIFALSEGGKNRVIIPETTLDELDAKKKGFDDTNFQSREFHRLLDQAKVVEEFSIKEEHEKEKISIVKIQIQDGIFELVSKREYKINITKEQINIVNDRKILEIAKAFPECIVVSNDIAMRIRARSLKLQSEPLKRHRNDNVEELEFIEYIQIESTQIDKIEGAKDSYFDKKFSFFTNVVFECTDTGRKILTFYKQTGFHIIDEKMLRKLPVKPKNIEQQFFLNMLLDPDVPIVVCAGVTGSGKNLLTLQAGVKYIQHVTSKLQSSIKYCRNTVTAGDSEAQLGFLKGDESSKLGVFTYPLIDAINTYIEIEEAIKEKKAFAIVDNKKFMEDHSIQIININQMRGSNLNGYLILDEWQNSSVSVNKLMLTRVVEGSKVIIIGDLHQIDHPHLSKYNNALAVMLKHAKTNDMVAGIKMSRVLRGKIAAFADTNL